MTELGREESPECRGRPGFHWPAWGRVSLHNLVRDKFRQMAGQQSRQAYREVGGSGRRQAGRRARAAGRQAVGRQTCGQAGGSIYPDLRGLDPRKGEGERVH